MVGSWVETWRKMFGHLYEGNSSLLQSTVLKWRFYHGFYGKIMGIYGDNRPGKHTKSEPENGNLVRGFTHEKGWIFPVRYVNVYQRVKYVEIHI